MKLGLFKMYLAKNLGSLGPLQPVSEDILSQWTIMLVKISAHGMSCTHDESKFYWYTVCKQALNYSQNLVLSAKRWVSRIAYVVSANSIVDHWTNNNTSSERTVEDSMCSKVFADKYSLEGSLSRNTKYQIQLNTSYTSVFIRIKHIFLSEKSPSWKLFLTLLCLHLHCVDSIAVHRCWIYYLKC